MSTKVMKNKPCRLASDLEPLQPLLKKWISFLETEVLPTSTETLRPRLQLKRADVWLGIKSLYVSLKPATTLSCLYLNVSVSIYWILILFLFFISRLGFLEGPAFEDGILERYPVFLNIILNHVSDDTSDFSYAVSCLKASFEMLGE